MHAKKAPCPTRWKPVSLGFGLRLPGGAAGAVAGLANALGVRAAAFVIAKPDNGWRAHWAGPWGIAGRVAALESGKRAVSLGAVVSNDAVAVPILFQGRCIAAVVLPTEAQPDLLTRNVLQDTGIAAIVREAAFDILAWESRTDALTGLSNTRSVRRQIEAAATESQSVALMMIDVDHFRTYNEKWGHEAGNEALVAVAAAITRAAGPRAIVGRYGGEEFIVAIPDCSQLQCVRAAESIRGEIKASDLPEGRGVTASIGCAISIGGDSDIGSLISSADSAMYRAKRNGRDRVEVFAPGADDPTADRLAGMSVLDLAEALRAVHELHQEVLASAAGHCLDEDQVRLLVASRLLEGEGEGGGAPEVLASLVQPRRKRNRKSA